MDLEKSGIYQIINKLNGRVYYGSAVKFKQRKSVHFSALRRNIHDNSFLQRDFNKCGEENFEFKIILYCDIDNLIFYEQRFLDKYFDNKVNCYNILPTAGSPLGYKHSEESKQKMSEVHKGNKYALGYKHTEKTKQKVSEASKKRWEKPKYREKINVVGMNNPNCNRTIYHFIHPVHGERYCTKFELFTEFELKSQSVSNLIYGRVKSLHGWRICYFSS